MAGNALEYQFLTGRPEPVLARRLSELSNDGWCVAHVTGDERSVVVLLQRPRSLESDAEILTALEEMPVADAVGIDIPAEERL